MPESEKEAPRRAKRLVRTRRAIEGRRRSRARVLWASGLTMAVSIGVALLLVLPGGLRACGASDEMDSAPLSTQTPAFPEIVVTVSAVSVALNGSPIAGTQAIRETNRVMRIDPLFDALKAQRAETGTDEVVLRVEEGTPPVVVKSAFQTIAFAGFEVELELSGDAAR